MFWRLAVASALLLLSTAGHAAKMKVGDITFGDDAPACAAHPAGEVCSYPAPSAQTAKAELKDKTFTVVQNGKFLDVVLRYNGNGFVFGNAPLLSGDVLTTLDRIDDGIWGKRLLLADLDHAALTLSVANIAGAKSADFLGPHADHSLIKIGTYPGIEAIALHSKALGAIRNIYVFRGENCRARVDGCHVVYFADGETIGTFLLNGPKGTALSKLVLVGLGSPPNTDNFGGNRVAELMALHHDPAYGRFQSFLTGEVIPKVEGHGKPTTRYVGGYSNGGAWALTTMLAHPDLFQGALAFSPAGFEPPSHVGASAHTIWIGCGTLEGAFHQDAKRYTKVLSSFHIDVKSHFFVGGHSANTWNALFWWAVASWN